MVQIHTSFNDCLLGYCHQSDVSKLPQVISDHCRVKYCNSRCLPCYFRLQTEKICNFLSFCQILMIFLPKCRPFYVVLEKGHGAGKKGMALEKRGMAWHHAKTG